MGIYTDGFRIVILGALDLKPGDKVLDVGCGDGWFSVQNALKYPDVKFIGVDLFEAREAEKISKLVGVENCKFYEMDALNMRIKEKVDHVVLFMTLGNICEDSFDIERLFRNCWKVMKSKSKVINS